MGGVIDIGEVAEAQAAVDGEAPYHARLQWVSAELMGERRWTTARYACDQLADDATAADAATQLQLVVDAATVGMRPWLQTAVLALPFAHAFHGADGPLTPAELRAASEAAGSVGGDRLAVPLRRLADLWAAAVHLRDRLPLAQGADDVQRLMMGVLDALATVDPTAEALGPELFDFTR